MLVPGGAVYLGESAPKTLTLAGHTPWWETFDNPELNALITTALKGNLTLKQFASRMEQADALRKKAEARLFPSLDASAARTRGDRNRLRGSDPDSSERSTSIGALLDWEADVWGKLSAGAGAARKQAEATRFDWLGARLLLSASVAETYLGILEQRQLLQLLDGQVEVNETLARLTELRFGQGQASIVDVLQQREQLEATKAIYPETASRLRELELGLDVLSGRAPQPASPVRSSAFPAPSRFRPGGIPSELLTQRPDLLAARERVAAIDLLLSESIADRLPSFTLGATLAAAGTPRLETLVTSLLAGAAAPLIDGGARQAEVEARRAALEEAVQDYSQLYLKAIEEVEAALVRQTRQAERVELLESQLQTAQKLLNESRNRYRNGLTDYLPVLAAIQSLQRLEREIISARRGQLSQKIAIHRALGGQ